MSARVECKCDPKFTCGYCLRNTKPWFWTCEDGSAIAVGPLQGKLCASPPCGRLVVPGDVLCASHLADFENEDPGNIDAACAMFDKLTRPEVR